jgi:APA family basic amino acid/polyamine antiporter
MKMVRPDTLLVRVIGRWDLVAILVNVVIGAGILGLPAKTYALIGIYSIAAWVACALIMGLIAACFAEVGSRFTQTGGTYLYAHAAFGPGVGFLVGWLAWVSRLFSFATIANLVMTYGGGFSPSLVDGIPRSIGIIAMTVILTVLVVTGTRSAALINNALTACKVVLLVGFAVGGLFFVHFSHIPTHAAPTAGDWQAAILLMSFAFLGIESTMITSGEMRNPRDDVPFALGVGLAIVAALYLAIQIVCIGTMPDLAASQRPVVDAATHAFGAAGGWIINAGALVTMLGALFAILLTGSRLPFAFAERGQLPPLLGAVHPRFRTPHVAILVTGILSGLFALYSSFLGALVVSALTRLVGYATTCAALIILRRRGGGVSSDSYVLAKKGGYRVAAGPLVAILALAACIWLMLASSMSELESMAVLSAAGMTVWVACAFVRRQRAQRQRLEQ